MIQLINENNYNIISVHNNWYNINGNYIDITVPNCSTINCICKKLLIDLKDGNESYWKLFMNGKYYDMVNDITVYKKTRFGFGFFNTKYSEDLINDEIKFKYNFIQLGSNFTSKFQEAIRENKILKVIK